MKTVRWLLILAVFVMCALGFYIIIQSKNKITVASSIPGKTATLTNRAFLEKKLNEVGFWKENNVSFYSGSQIVPVTVKKLEIVLVEMPQLYGRLVDDPNSVSPYVFLSFGTDYDAVTKKMTLLLHAAPQEESSSETDRRYTYELLSAIYDVTHRLEEGNTGERLDGIEKYLSNSEVVIKTE